MTNTTNQAFAEISDILTHLDRELYNKVPKSFIEIVNSNKDRNYKINIDYSQDINSQILRETKVILGLMYRDYFVSKEESVKLKSKDNYDLKVEENKLREKYNPDNIFKAKTKNIECENVNLPIEIKKENIIIRFINLLKKFFNKY